MTKFGLLAVALASLVVVAVLPASSFAASTDTAPPVLSNYDFTPKTVDVQSGGKQVTVSVHLTDATGASAPTVEIDSDSTSQYAGFGSMVLTAGTAQDGDWSKTITIPSTAAAGSWTVELYPLQDTLGNSDQTFEYNPTKLNVTNASTDTAPPVLSNYDFTPKTVDVQSGGKQVTVSVHLTDATGASAPTVEIDSDSTSQYAGFGSMVLTAGTAQDGDWSKTITIPSTAAAGSWTVELYPLQDTLGNSDQTFEYNPTKLNVTNASTATAPGVPTDVAASAGNAQAVVSWTAPASDGGFPIINYTVTTYPGAATTTVASGTTATTIAGLTNGTSYAFTVKATNIVGDSPASTPSNNVTPVAPTPAASAPSAPAAVSASAGNAQAVVSWAVPASDGGLPITNYTVTTYPGAATTTVPSSATATTIAGLTNGTSYAFTVKATNIVGDSPASTPSNNVTPLAPPTVPGLPTATVLGAVLRPKALVSGTKVVLTWKPPKGGSSPVTSYLVTGPHHFKKSLNKFRTRIVLNGLAPRRYKFVVVALSSAGLGKPAPIRFQIHDPQAVQHRLMKWPR